MKISFLQAPMFPFNLSLCGGMERVEIEELMRLQQRGHDVKLYISEYKSDSIARPAWLRIIKDFGWKSRFLKWVYPVKFLVLNLNADIFHGHYTTYICLIGGNKSLVHFHGFVISELPLYRFKWAKKRYHQAHYVFCAEHLLKTYLEKYPDLPKEHLHVIYNGIDINRFQPLNGERKPGPTRFSYHGRWSENKGITFLIEALKILESKGIDFECYVAGSPEVGLSPDGSKLSVIINEMSRGLKRIKFPGAIQYNDLPTFLKDMDFSVVPSVYPDPFPLVPLENMSCGLPVVAFDIGGLRESVIPGKTGLLVENKNSVKLAEAIERLINDDRLLLSMRKSARKHVEQNFSWDRHIDQLEELYHDILGSRRNVEIQV